MCLVLQSTKCFCEQFYFVVFIVLLHRFVIMGLPPSKGFPGTVFVISDLLEMGLHTATLLWTQLIGCLFWTKGFPWDFYSTLDPAVSGMPSVFISVLKPVIPVLNDLCPNRSCPSCRLSEWISLLSSPCSIYVAMVTFATAYLILWFCINIWLRPALGIENRDFILPHPLHIIST